MNKRHRLFFTIIIVVIIMKLALFAFAAIHAPQGKILPDSHDYLRLSDTLASKGVFAVQYEKGNFIYETLRTPGYPLFLAFFNGVMQIPLDGVIFLQVIITVLAAFIVYKSALIIDQRIALLSAAIILLDPPISIFSLLILTETLFMFSISLFMLCFTLYLNSRKLGPLILSAFMLVIAIYIRPIGYYLGFAIMLFVIYANMRENIKRSIVHALIFLAIVYCLLGIWQYRNYVRSGDFAFSAIERANLSSMGLIKSYARNTDINTKDMAPLPYYANVSFRCLMSLMTRPGNFKYFGYEPLNLGSFVFSYPWMVFWLSGFIWGIIRIARSTVVAQPQDFRGRAGFGSTSLTIPQTIPSLSRDNLSYLQFMLFVTFFFIAISVVGQMWGVGPRFRVPMMPFIAIISAYGWTCILPWFKARNP